MEVNRDRHRPGRCPGRCSVSEDPGQRIRGGRQVRRELAQGALCWLQSKCTPLKPTLALGIGLPGVALGLPERVPRYHQPSCKALSPPTKVFIHAFVDFGFPVATDQA